MARVKQQMKPIIEEIERLEAERGLMVARYDAQLDALRALLQKVSGIEPEVKEVRKRSANIKPLILDIMAQAGFTGATSSEVDMMVRQTAPTVAKDSVGSILSRLKSAGALAHDGERYYEKRYAPRPITGGADPPLKAVN